MDMITLAAARKYVNDTANALGAVKGSPCTIKSITETDEGATVMFSWTGADGVEQTSSTFLPRGPKGKEGDPGGPGNSPDVEVAAIDGGHRVTITDATGTHTFDVLDGKPGKDGSGVDTEAREQIAALSEEIEQLKNNADLEVMDATKSGEIVTVTPVGGTTAKVVSKITGQNAGWQYANQLVLRHVKGKNLFDIASALGGVGTVFEKDGLRAVVNENGTITFSGTNVSAETWNNLISVKLSTEDRVLYPPGTYTVSKHLKLALYEAASGTVFIGNKQGTFVVDRAFWIDKVSTAIAAGVTLNETVPLALVEGTAIPSTGYEYEGATYQATFTAAVTDGVFDWQTGILKDVDGNQIEAGKPFDEFPVFDGANTFFTGAGVSTVTYKVPDDGSGEDNSTAALDSYMMDAPLKKIDSSYMFLPVFHHVGCIGDSLASGESAYTDDDGQHFVDLYEHSWGQYLARATGNTYYNFSRGGLTAKTWLATQAEAAFDGTKKCEAYIIGLGHNDSKGDAVGASTDINMSDYTQNADTFYGNYGKIIQMIKEHQPKAKIFVLTAAAEGVESGGYNTAVRTIADMFSNVYLLDLYNNKGLHFASDSFLAKQARVGHYNAVGYKYISAMIGSYIDWYMYNHPEEFEQVEFIGTDYEWTD